MKIGGSFYGPPCMRQYLQSLRRSDEATVAQRIQYVAATMQIWTNCNTHHYYTYVNQFFILFLVYLFSLIFYMR